MARDFEIEVEPELEPLLQALRDCGISDRRIAQIIGPLTEPPESLALPSGDRTAAANDWLQTFSFLIKSSIPMTNLHA
jgi:hypothetical protein